LRIALLVLLHLAALGLLIAFESEPVGQAAFVLTCGFLNFFWLTLLRRPLTSALLSLALLVALMAASQFKHEVLMMTAPFVALLIIGVAPVSSLVTVMPGLAGKAGLALALAIPVLILAWRNEPFRPRRGMAALACALCFAALVVLAFALPLYRED